MSQYPGGIRGTVYGSPLPSPPRRRRRGLIVAGLVAVLLLGTGAITYAWHNAGASEVSRDTELAAVGDSSSRPTATRSPSRIAGTPGPSRAATGAPDRSKDSGVALCARMRDANARAVAAGGLAPGDDGKPTDYRYLRKQFADSRYADIRKAGTRFIDTFWLMPTPTITDAAQIAKDIGRTLVATYTPLARACANHGVQLPPLTGG